METNRLSLKKIEDFLLLRTIYSKIVAIYMLFSVVLFFFMNLAVTQSISRLEENMMLERLKSDINYAEDLLRDGTDYRWRVVNDEIYFGDVLIGDGTEEKANLEPFLELERKTGTFSYVFILDEDAKLGFVEGNEVAEGYHEGHYLRVAGSTRGPDGKSIVGTYITKNVADVLDKEGVYAGEANVAGGMIYCLYRTLSNQDGNVVGAIVVGRNITELKSQISDSARKISYFMFFTIVICGIFMIFLTSRWISAVKVIANYLRQIEKGIIPDKLLSLDTRDEMSLISEGINRMVKSLEENNKLRKKSETDALTGLPNRFALYSYAKKLYQEFEKQPQNLALEIVDIDFFKQYNDNYGHSAGDECIQTVAGIFGDLTKEYENIFVCRYGGDEFVFIYHGYSKEEIRNMLATLKGKILSLCIEHEYSKISDVVTITQGVCFGMFDGRYRIEDFFERADNALYDVKKVTRNDFNIVDISDSVDGNEAEDEK